MKKIIIKRNSKQKCICLKGKNPIYRAIHLRANLTRTFKTEYQPPTGGTTEQEIKWFPAFFIPFLRKELNPHGR
jgi:hypothetical protein